MSAYAIDRHSLCMPWEREGRDSKPIATSPTRLVFPTSAMIPAPGIEALMPWMSKAERIGIGKLLLLPVTERTKRANIMMMAGELADYVCLKFLDIPFGKTAYSGPTTNVCVGLWTAALTDTFNGATASEANYTSYARLLLAAGTTAIFPAATVATSPQKVWPADATKSWPASTGGATPACTYMGVLDGNAGTSADNALAWCTITSTTINNGDTPQLAQNAVTMTLD